MDQWTLEQKTYLLKLLCFNRPLIKDLNMLLLTVKEQFSKKFDTDDSNISETNKQFNEKINEFYDIQGLLKLEMNDSNSSSGSSVTEEIKKNDNDEEDDAKKQLKHVIIDEDKNKVFDESIEKLKELEPAVPKVETKEAEIQDENPVIVNTEPEVNDTPVINEQEQQEVTFDESIKETKEETDEEEPVHLTRAQARKLHIDVVKEAEQNEKKTHDIEEARKQKSTESDDETSNAFYSETDETVKKPKSTGKIDDNTTPRRSTRLRRKSNQGIDDVEIANDHVGTRTRSVSSTRTINQTQSENDNDDASDATDVKEVPRRGRRRKLIANLSENENEQQPQQSVRKTRSRKSSEFEDDEKNKSVTEDKDNESHADDEKEENKTEEEEEDPEQEQESSEEDADQDTTRLRRSSRKRKSESIEPQTPKKQKSNQPIPNTDMSKRRSKKIKNVSPTPNEAVSNVGDEEHQSVASRTRRR